MRHIQAKMSVKIAMVIALGSLVGIVAMTVIPWNPFDGNAAPLENSVALTIPRPEDTEELTELADAIVIGRVGAPLRTAYEMGFDIETGTYPECESRICGLAVTYYSIQIDDAIFDDGFIERNAVLRVGGHPEDSTRLHPSAEKEYVMFLFRNTDNRSYGYPGSWNVLSVESGEMRDLLDQPIDFGDGSDANRFMTEIRQASVRKSPRP